MTNGSNLPGFANFSDADFQTAIWSALRLVGLATLLGIPLLWWKLGWPSAALLAVGALISGTGIFEWLRLMTALMARMDTTGENPAPARPLAPVLIGFFLRLAGALALLYVSLKVSARIGLCLSCRPCAWSGRAFDRRAAATQKLDRLASAR